MTTVHYAEERGGRVTRWAVQVTDDEARRLRDAFNATPLPVMVDFVALFRRVTGREL